MPKKDTLGKIGEELHKELCRTDTPCVSCPKFERCFDISMDLLHRMNFIAPDKKSIHMKEFFFECMEYAYDNKLMKIYPNIEALMSTTLKEGIIESRISVGRHDILFYILSAQILHTIFRVDMPEKYAEQIERLRDLIPRYIS